MSEDDKIIFLGDYIDYGSESYQVLKYLFELQKKYGQERVIVLKGNHEAMFLEWIDDFSGRKTSHPHDIAYESWIVTDSERDFRTFRTFFSSEIFEEYEEFCKKASYEEINLRAVELLIEYHSDLISWISGLPLYYETDTQIFVHAGIDEEAEEYWKIGTSDDIFLWKYPPTFGSFYKDIIAGHVGTSSLAEDNMFHDVFYDGESHYFIDGSVYGKGKLLVLGCDKDGYYQFEDGKKGRIRSTPHVQNAHKTKL